MVEAPLKLVVTELQEGTVSIRMADPTTAFGRYGNSALASFGKELAKRLASGLSGPVSDSSLNTG
jgi:hypothetical protein